ncbi:MAG: hypothetical protein AVDCRST_MAG13-2517, partial [uncultured Solirubrobacteraceae bacterium]
ERVRAALRDRACGRRRCRGRAARGGGHPARPPA